LGLLAVLAIALLGYFPVQRHWGEMGVWSLAAGCGASWVAGCVGALPIAGSLSRKGDNVAIAVLMATALRFGVVLIVTVSLFFTGWFDRVILFVCVAVSYLWTLLFETLYAVRQINRLHATRHSS